MKATTLLAVGFCTVLSLIGSLATACTGITIRAANGDVVFCRTLEFDASLVPSEILVYPRNHSFKAALPDAAPGMSWKGKYGVAGLGIIPLQSYTDAMNEKGLIAGIFITNITLNMPRIPRIGRTAAFRLSTWFLSSFRLARASRK